MEYPFMGDIYIYIYIYIFNPLSLLLTHTPSPNGKRGDLFLSLGGILH